MAILDIYRYFFYDVQQVTGGWVRIFAVEVIYKTGLDGLVHLSISLFRCQETVVEQVEHRSDI